MFWKWGKYILKDDWRSFYGGMQNIQELGRRSSKIGKKKFLDSYKKFWNIYSRCSKVLYIKNSHWEIRCSGSGVNIF